MKQIILFILIKKSHYFSDKKANRKKWQSLLILTKMSPHARGRGFHLSANKSIQFHCGVSKSVRHISTAGWSLFPRNIFSRPGNKIQTPKPKTPLAIFQCTRNNPEACNPGKRRTNAIFSKVLKYQMTRVLSETSFFIPNKKAGNTSSPAPSLRWLLRQLQQQIVAI